MSTLDNPAAIDTEKVGQFLRTERLRVTGFTAHDHARRYSFDEAAIYVAWASEQMADLLASRCAIAELNERLRYNLKALIRSYVSMLHIGRERIIEAGGDCDPVEMMEAGDSVLIAAKAAAEACIQKAAPDTSTGGS